MFSNRLFVVVLTVFCSSFLCSAEKVETSVKKTICLNMIVKNEKDVITRCLQSVLPFIDTWVIVDTGSTDGTQEIIKDFMKEIPGELHERSWVNFAHNRQEALLLAKNKADYIFIMDADDVLSASENFKMPDLDKDFYMILSQHPKEVFWIHRLIKASLPWFWQGVIHEDLQCEVSLEGQALEGLVYMYMHDGARGKDPLTLQKDIQILLEATKNEPNNPRNYFYLARTYLHNGDFENALKYFKMRSEMKGSLEELFSSKLCLAKIQFALDFDPKIVQKSFFEAYQSRAHRVEPLYYLVKSLRKQGDFVKGYEIAHCALELPKNPNDYHCLEKWIYDFGLLSELAYCAAQSNHSKEAIEIIGNVLSQKDLPEDLRKEMEALLESIYQKNVEKFEKKIASILF